MVPLKTAFSKTQTADMAFSSLYLMENRALKVAIYHSGGYGIRPYGGLMI